MNVTLDVVKDTACFEVYAEIVVPLPDSTEAAQVRITDKGSVTWTRNYWAEPNSDVITRGDRRTWTITDPAALAEDIKTTLTSARPARLRRDRGKARRAVQDAGAES